MKNFEIEKNYLKEENEKLVKENENSQKEDFSIEKVNI